MIQGKKFTTSEWKNISSEITGGSSSIPTSFHTEDEFINSELKTENLPSPRSSLYKDETASLTGFNSNSSMYQRLRVKSQPGVNYGDTSYEVLDPDTFTSAESTNQRMLDEKYYEWQVARKLINATTVPPSTKKAETTTHTVTTEKYADLLTDKPMFQTSTVASNLTTKLSKEDLLSKLSVLYNEYSANPDVQIVSPKSHMHSTLGVVDFGKLDVRVGRITEVMFHPKSNKMYICDVDVGIGKPLPVVGSLGPLNIADLMMRWVIVLCNVKPSENNGVMSFGKILLAMKGDLVEPLTPPRGCNPGDVVTVRGYIRNPYRQLEPRYRIFQFVAQLFNINNESIAIFRGIPWEVRGIGFVHTYDLRSCIVR